jgi:purine nucleoside permease
MSLRAPTLVAALVLAAPALASEPFLAPKVLVVTMFPGETKPWLENEALPLKVTLPGLTKANPDVACSEAGLCVLTTGMGYANAASSIASLVFGERFDLTKTYFIIAGIAGVDPTEGTLGSVHWARFAADAGLLYEIDADGAPPGWDAGLHAFDNAREHYGDIVYRLNEDLLQAAYRLSKNVELVDDDAAKAYRAKYPESAAAAPPKVTICDTISSDTWWFGKRLAAAMMAHAKDVAGGEAKPCTTQQEDNATLTALKRGADAGLIDFNRIAVVRAASDFDREPPGETAAGSILARTGGYPIAVTNAYRAASALVHAIAADWETWKAGPPKALP